MTRNFSNPKAPTPGYLHTVISTSSRATKCIALTKLLTAYTCAKKNILRPRIGYMHITISIDRFIAEFSSLIVNSCGGMEALSEVSRVRCQPGRPWGRLVENKRS